MPVYDIAATVEYGAPRLKKMGMSAGQRSITFTVTAKSSKRLTFSVRTILLPMSAIANSIFNRLPRTAQTKSSNVCRILFRSVINSERWRQLDFHY